MQQDNFRRLHAHEESVRDQSLVCIATGDDLRRHAVAIETAMDVIHFFAKQPIKDQDAVTVQLLGIRLFNSLASATKLALSGYYQTSVLQQRDILETAFLLNYFKHDMNLVRRWRECSADERFKEFSPKKVRKRLDAKQGFTSGRRTQAYKLMCDLAAHPTPLGFAMLKKPDGLHDIGPFWDPTSLDAVWSELAKHAMQAAPAFAQLISDDVESRHIEALRMRMRFLGVQADWFEYFFGPWDRTELNAAKTILAEMER